MWKITAMHRISKLIFFVIPAVIALIIPAALAQTKPVVVSTSPANGATGVSRFLGCMSVTFSKPMYVYGGCGLITQNWRGAGLPGGSCTWSADQLTMTYCRPDPSNDPLIQGSVVTASMNPAGGSQ